MPHDPIEISGKIVEEMGFDKINRKLAELKELKVVLLDDFCISGVLPGYQRLDEAETAQKEIGSTCPKIKELDLSRNLLDSWHEVFDICRQLQSLRLLKLKYV